MQYNKSSLLQRILHRQAGMPTVVSLPAPRPGTIIVAYFYHNCMAWRGSKILIVTTGTSPACILVAIGEQQLTAIELYLSAIYVLIFVR